MIGGSPRVVQVNAIVTETFVALTGTAPDEGFAVHPETPGTLLL